MRSAKTISPVRTLKTGVSRLYRREFNGPLAGFRALLLFLALLASLLPAQAQLGPVKIARIEIKHRGPQTVSDELIRSHVRVKAGDTFSSGVALAAATDDDIRSLYATGFFYNIQLTQTPDPEGTVVTYIVQGNPRIIAIKFQGNTKYSDAKLLKKISAKVGEPFNERKLFTDALDIQTLYQKGGYPHTGAEYHFTIEEATGRATVTFEISESPKIKIVEVDFVGARVFSQSKLRKEVKTRKHWMFSWITGHGILKDDVLEEDREQLAQYYRDHGYIDFEIKDVQFVYPTARTMIVRFIIYEGVQYKVGSVKFTGNQVFSLADLTNKTSGLPLVQAIRGWHYKLGPNGLPMDVGDVFTPKGLTTNIDMLEDFYGSRGYIDVSAGSRNLAIFRIPNTEAGTMDLEFKIEEGKKYDIEKIEIHGNSKTKDKVIRRELAVSPGETFDMLRVKLSKTRLEGLQYFDRVDARPQGTDVQNAKDLVIGVDERNTGNFSLGAGFSSVDEIVGFAEVTQANFDLFHPPTFTGGGEKFSIRVQLGTVRQDYGVSFVEPWLFGRKLAMGVDAYYHDWDFQSLNGLYNEVRAGGRVSLTRALGSDWFIGSVHYGLESVGIRLNPGYTGPIPGNIILPGPGGAGVGGVATTVPGNVPTTIVDEQGYHLLSRLGGSLAYDTRNGVLLPDKGQRTEFSAELAGGPLGGDKTFYKLELKSGWYFKGLLPGHVLELIGQTGVAESLQSGDVPFYERYYLGGLYSMRGFKYRSVSPREYGYSEPIGGDSYWFGSAEYSIPVIERLRLAVFYDAGQVSPKPFSYDFSNLNDNWGIGLRLNLPIGPLRLDYGIPIHHDQYNGTSGQFQFGVGYTRQF
jgi:outer membrane protein insertion porin family